MPDYRRIYADGGTYFLTACLQDRRSDLLVREIALLLASWREVAAARVFETIAAVVLPDHMHFLWRLPDDDHNFPARMARLKTGFTRRLPEGVKGRGRKQVATVFQAAALTS
jgi:putative transposase